MNRLDAIERVGLKCEISRKPWSIIISPRRYPRPYRVRVVAGVDPYAYAASLNAHRRHLTPQEQRDAELRKRERIAELLKADPIKSDRSIAETVGASPTTVGKVRANVQGGHNTERTEKTGRKARGRKPASNKLKLDHDKPDDVQASATIEDAQDGMSAAEAPPTKPGLDEDIARINTHWEDLERNFIKMIWCLVRTWQDFQLDRLVAVAPDRLEAEDITQLAAWLTHFAASSASAKAQRTPTLHRP